MGVLKDPAHYCLCYIKHETKKILLQDSGEKAGFIKPGLFSPVLSFSHDTTHKWQEAWFQAAKAHALEEVFRGGRLRSVVVVVLRGGVDVDAAHAYLCVCVRACERASVRACDERASVRACERASVRACERASVQAAAQSFC